VVDADVTSYAVQGATYGSSTSRIDERASRAEAYVDLTRGRDANHLFVTRAADPLDGERLPKVPPPPIAESVARRLGESGPERAAVELDPTAAQLASRSDSSIAAATTAGRHRALRGERASRLARYDPPADLVMRLPERPGVPHLARRWDETVAAIVNYRARWNTAPTDGPFGWALGTPPGQREAGAHRNEVIDQIVRLVVLTTTEDLRRHGSEQLPAWACRHLAEEAEVGRCSGDPGCQARLYERISDYRRTHGFDDDAGAEEGELPVALLGPRPPSPAEATEYDLLWQEIAGTLQPVRSTERGIA
jgi:hypothetical protein